MFDMQAVKSSQIHAIGYDGPSQTLAIQFHSGVANGVHYEYNPVPRATYDGLIGAGSIGKYFGEHIKGNPKIGFKKVSLKEAA